MLFSKQSLTRNLFSFLSFFSILSTILQPVALAYLFANPQSTHAQENNSIELSYNQNDHILALGSTHTYSLYYQTDSSTEAVFGTGSSIFVGSASTDSISPDKLIRGILKTNSNTYYFVTNSVDIDIVLTLPTISSELTQSEQEWLISPNTYSDLRTGVVYSAPFNPDFSLTFDSLPANPGSITFNQIILTDEQMLLSGALDELAYEVTSTMSDGTFSYSLTLPNPIDDEEVGIQYSEDGHTFHPVTEITATTTEVTATELDHFTIFVITGIHNSPGVRINEFLYNPSSGSEWIELYNTESYEVDLTNWRLTDAALNSTLLSGSIPAHGYRLFNVNFLNNTGSSSSTESITLSYPILNIVDRVTYTRSFLLGILLGGDVVSSDNTMLDKSIGRSPDGGSNWTSYDAPTPGYSNLGDTTPPSVPVSGSPHNTIIPTNNFDFTWDPSTDASPITYEFQSSQNPAQSGGVLTTGLWQSGTLPTNMIHSSGAPDGTWYWQVRATDSFGNASDWSEIWQVTLDTTPPSAPTLLTPVNGAYVSGNPTQSWQNISDADHYIYQSSLYSDFSLIAYTTTVSTNTRTVGGLQTTNFWWRVRAVDSVGNMSPWSVPFLLHVDNTDPIAKLLSPLSTVLRGSITVRGKVEDTNPWRYYAVVLNSAGSIVYGPGTVYDSNSFADKLLFTWDTTTFSDGNYSIHLAARDLAGNRGASSEDTITVSVDNTPPLKPTGLHRTTPDLLTTYACNAVVKRQTLYPTWDDMSIADPSFSHYEYVSFTPSGSIGTTQTLYTNRFVHSWVPTTDGTNGYAVRSVDTAGNYSDWALTEKSLAGSCQITYDSTPPTLADQTEYSGWYNTPQLSEFTYADTYGISSGNPASCTISTEGLAQTCSVTPNVIDNAGNSNTTIVTSNPANLDFTDPSSIIISPANSGNNTTLITNSWDGIIKGTASDNLSSVATVHLSIRRGSDSNYWGGAAWVAGTEETTRILASGTTDWSYDLGFLPPEDTYTIISHATDLAGNTENSYSLTIVLDKTIPEVAITLDPASPNGSNGWYLTLPTITLSATDAHISSIEYQWDSLVGSWTTYVAPFSAIPEGAHILYYRAHDSAGNTSAVGIKNLRHDQTELTNGPLNVSVSPNPTGSSTATVKWDPAKDNVGINYYQVQWKLGDQVYSKSVGYDVFEQILDQLTEGSWSVTVTAYDYAGHSKEGTTNLVVDTTAPAAPTLSLGVVTPSSVGLTWTQVAGSSSYIIWYGTSAGNYLYAADVGNTTSYTVSGLGGGSYYFVVQAKDSAANFSGFSNEVSSGTIAGLPGVNPESPAPGFEPAVLGDNTSTQQTIPSDSQSSTEGSVLGDNTEYWSYWWLILLIIVILYASYRYYRYRRGHAE